jgi:hypothetical protein
MTKHANVNSQNQQKQKRNAVARHFSNIYGYALLYILVIRREIDNPNYAASPVAQMIMQVCTYAAISVGSFLFDSREVQNVIF